MQERVKNIITEVAEENNIQPKKLIEAYNIFWKLVKEKLQDRIYYRILIHNFGHFEVRYGRAHHQVMYLIDKIKRMKKLKSLDCIPSEYCGPLDKAMKGRKLVQEDYIHRHKLRIKKNHKKWILKDN